MTNPTSYTDEQVLSAIEALGSYETMCGFAHILAGVFADRQRLQAEVEALRTALLDVLPYVVSDTLEHCDGNKCRESWCIGCSGSEYAEESVAKANAASSKAYALLKPNETKEAKS